MFKESVRDLIKICFPDGFPKKIGLNVIQPHMSEAGATEKKISQMSDLFRSEMIHQLAWILAGYMETPEKIELDLLDADDLPSHFETKVDLFAYHALAIVKRGLGTKATDKRIRRKMDEILAAMSKEEIRKWKASF
ncbi:uncharacterized protein BDR25DRAFT_311147 [Lindgomyces ingoldianus]|uniref:Uncharacterized protein n=1 Tax=Lindgomyces ingoldianus TaxID=673940 RepID=A0ACB6R8Q7_9PLEO|nr:uncharacterized protein BDR25DRAFT_311147 [Lindgomyces ingoldianus]KAF2474710.1 hypothetical protein BDR25DRAFT_311147 [Lindgomyces ingoldianus]